MTIKISASVVLNRKLASSPILCKMQQWPNAGMVWCQKTSIQGVRIHSNLNHMTAAQSFKIAAILVSWDMNWHYRRDMKKHGETRSRKVQLNMVKMDLSWQILWEKTGRQLALHGSINSYDALCRYSTIPTISKAPYQTAKKQFLLKDDCTPQTQLASKEQV